MTGSEGSRKKRGAEWEREEKGSSYGVLGPTVVYALTHWNGEEEEVEVAVRPLTPDPVSRVLKLDTTIVETTDDGNVSMTSVVHKVSLQGRLVTSGEGGMRRRED